MFDASNSVSFVSAMLQKTIAKGVSVMKGFLSIKDTAKIWGVSIHWVNQYILEGRIPGCERFGRSWQFRLMQRNRKSNRLARKGPDIQQSVFFEFKLAKTNIRMPRKAEEA